MATYLELAQKLRSEAGIAGSGPSSVTFQTGELKRLVDWVASAWNDIQIAKPNWLWMQGEYTFTTTIGKRTYTSVEAGIATRFSHWNVRSVRLGLTPPNDEQTLSHLTYDEYRDIYLTGPQPLSRPVVVTVTPNQSLGLGYAPNDVYTVIGEYQKAPQKLLTDSDTPEMPEQFHDAILYAALMKYARYMAAGEIYQDAQMNYRRVFQNLQVHQLPSITEPEALA